MIPDLIIGILAIIQQVIPLLGAGAPATDAIGTIVAQLIKWLPLIIKEVSVLYDPVKNIITALSAHPATTDDQAAALAGLDAKLDAEFDLIVKDVDPDNPPAV